MFRITKVYLLICGPRVQVSSDPRTPDHGFVLLFATFTHRQVELYVQHLGIRRESSSSLSYCRSVSFGPRHDSPIVFGVKRIPQSAYNGRRTGTTCVIRVTRQKEQFILRPGGKNARAGKTVVGQQCFYRE